MASVQDIYDEITRIDNAKQGIAEAIEEKGVQVPAGTPIQNFPAKVREIQTGSPDAVLYTPQELTPEQQEQARENIGAGTYTKPGTGIPKTDLAAGVQTSLGKADTALQPAALTPITELIPEQATPQNQLADKNFVNSSVATNTANYISDNGQPFQSVEDLEAYTGTLTNNDYAFVVGTDSAGNTTYTRYKYNANTQTWAAEYVLNNSSFTAAQWAAISSGITALLVQKLSDLPTEVVTYVAQTLTEAQKQQARTNIGATAPEIFWATYGTTTAAEIDAVVAAGKQVLIFDGGWVYTYAGKDTGYHYFFAIVGNITYRRIQVQISTNGWARHAIGVQGVSSRVQTLTGNETSEIYYPSTKAVADALGKMGVVSQKITWNGEQYTLSEITNGLIPQELINQATYWGAVFNTTTGYFEYCGYTDIAADEMREAILTRVSTPATAIYRTWAQFKRIVLPYSAINGSVNEMFMSCGKLRIIPASIGYNFQQIGSNSFNGCRQLREIRAAIYGNSAGISLPSCFAGCASLEYANIYSLQRDLNLADAAAYLVNSIRGHITGRSGTNAITITLHADAYARCQADTTEYTYEGQTYTGIIAYAAAKNITIASA